MKLATWNVNSLNVRLPHVMKWLGENPVDVLCIQETKMTDDKFPVKEIEEAGYQVVFSGQKTYNGVAILSRHPMEDVVRNNPHYPDEQQRLLAATINGIRVVCAYVPNGQDLESDKYTYKLGWMQSFRDWMEKELARNPHLAVLGDYNIVPDIRDSYDPAMEGQIFCSDKERAALQALLDLGLKDSFRLFEQAEKTFTWWDYRMLGFQKNKGLRIDHVLLSAPLVQRCTSCVIDRAPRKWQQPSDHAPVIATLG